MAKPFKIGVNWQLVLRELGLDAGSVLRRAGLSPERFNRDALLFTEEEYFGLCEAIEAEMTGRPAPLELGQNVSIEAFDPAIFAALCSPNLNIATQRLSKFKRLVGPFKLDVSIEAEATTLTMGSIGALELPASLGLTEIVFFVSFVRRATRAPINPLRVTTLRKPAYLDRYEDFFGIRLKTGPAFSVQFSAIDAARPFLTANAEMWRFFEPVLNERLEEMDKDATTAERVHAALYEMLPSGRSAIQDVAGFLGMSTRSLQRYLKQEDTSFKNVLNQTREELAVHYLRKSDLSTAEISFLLGFEEPNSFFRAFRSWTGQTPQSLRAAFSQ